MQIQGGEVVMTEGSSALEAYLTDHMAGSVSANDLAKGGVDRGTCRL
jgi:hypothetical protein